MRSGFLGRGIGPVALKRRRAAADWWQVAGQTCVAAYKAIGAASLAASYVNLANPGTYDAAPGVAPTLAAGGWSFNGSTQYLTTGVVPGLAFSVAIRYVSTSSVTQSLYGVYQSDTQNYIFQPIISSSLRGLGNGSYVSSLSPAYAGGIHILAGKIEYRNGSATGTTLANGGTNPTFPLFIGSYSNSGAPSTQLFSGTIAAVAIYSTTLSAADVAALTTRMQALA